MGYIVSHMGHHYPNGITPDYGTQDTFLPVVDLSRCPMSHMGHHMGHMVIWDTITYGTYMRHVVQIWDIIILMGLFLITGHRTPFCL